MSGVRTGAADVHRLARTAGGKPMRLPACVWKQGSDAQAAREHAPQTPVAAIRGPTPVPAQAGAWAATQAWRAGWWKRKDNRRLDHHMAAEN